MAGRPHRRRAEDSPEVTRLKQKLDVAAAFLLFAIAAILARRFLAHVKSGTSSSRDAFHDSLFLFSRQNV